jgi:metal-responsive CopG/Arc/MetJ family transcriptional regulator
MAREKSTEQLNLRIPKELIEDLDKIASILKVNKSEWIKIKLGELVYEEKSRLLQKYSELKDKGMLNDKEYKELIK